METTKLILRKCALILEPYFKKKKQRIQYTIFYFNELNPQVRDWVIEGLLS